MLPGDDRGQSMQIGAILLFALFIVGLSFTQAFLVPQENKGVEFGSYVEASDDLTAYYHDVLAAGTQGSQTGQTVETGVRYPPRTILINPGPAAGTVRTTGARNVTIDGVEAVSGEDRNVRGFWDTSARGPRNYSTREVAFEPAYNEFNASPVVVSSVGTYRLGSGGQVALTEQSFLSGNRITLVTIDGDVETGGLSTSLSAAPTSVATRSVTVTGDGGSDFRITLPVPGNAAAWNVSSGARSLRTNPNVVGTEVNGSRVDVTFDGSARYTLRLAKVTVRDNSDSDVETDTEPRYVTSLDGNGTVVPYNNATTLGVEVRDRYNNPVEGATVEFSATSGAFVSGTTVTTDSEGHATVEYDIQGNDSATVTANLTASDESWAESVFTVFGSAPSQNADSAQDQFLDLGQATNVFINATAKTGGNKGVEITFENQGSDTWTAKEIRFITYYSAGSKAMESVDYDGQNLVLRATFEPLATEYTIGPGDTEVVVVNDLTDTAGNSVSTSADHFFVLSIVYERPDGTRRTSTYFRQVG